MLDYTNACYHYFEAYFNGVKHFEYQFFLVSPLN